MEDGGWHLNAMKALKLGETVASAGVKKVA